MQATAAFRTVPTAANAGWQPSRRTALASSAGALAALTAAPRTLTVAAAADLPVIPTAPIIPGLSISRIIKGNWQLSGGHGGDRASDRTSGNAAVEDFQAFVDAGITTFDTADIYGPSEKLIGAYLASHPDARSKTQVFTKFCCFGDSMRQARDAKFVERGIDGSRSRLGVDALDCVQFYWHDYNTSGYVDAALHLSELQSKGKIKTVGVTNFDVKRLSEMCDAGVDVKVNQIQYSLLDPRPDNGMIEFCAARGINVIPYGTVAGGFLSDAYLGIDPGKVSLDTYSKSKYASVINQRGGWDFLQRLLGVLRGVADQYDVGVAEVASRWVLQRPAVAAVIVGARNATHVEQHRRTFGFELSAGDLAAIEAALAEGKRPASDVYTWERGGKW
jgi:aryl-alcohol dehydrogenase-like predicted oxidoreductase